MSLLTQASICITPNGYKEGKLYSVIPSDGSGDMSVTRATTATRVNSAGLVELVPYNLFQYSEQFNDAIWVKQLGSSVTANTTTAPDGTLTADTLSIAPSQYMYQNLSANAGVTYTISIYVKVASGTKQFKFNTYSGNGNDFTSSVFTATTEWQRFTYSFTAVSNATTGIYPILVDGLAGGNFFIWGAQLVEGSTAKDYQKTETRLNIPRLDYSNGTCPSLLVEPQRTNLLTYSSSFDNAAWAILQATISVNSAISPSGIQDADKLVENTNNSSHVVYRADAGTTNNFSFYAKAAGRDWVYVLCNDGTNTFFNIANGTLGTISSTSTATIEDAGNGWYRCSVYNTHGTFGASIHLSTGNNVLTYTGNGTSGAYLWGAQLEAGSYATSYIPTTSASVTRNADVISKTGISSLIGQTEGTIFWEGQIDGCQNLAANIINSEKNTNTSFTISYIKTNLKMQGSVFASGVEYNLQGGSVNIGETAKLAYAYKSGDSALYVNGVQVASSSNTFTFPSSFDDIFIGDPATYFAYQEGISTKAAAIWKTRLTNDQLEALTGTGFNTYAEMAEYYNYVLQ
jgi:hypothetical protein